MSTTINKVAIAGASGNVGKPITRALLDAGFQVTALTRPESTATFPPEVVVQRVDLKSVDAITQALQGHDAFISTTSTGSLADQKAMIDAAVAARVKRFVPSEFGILTREVVGSKFSAHVAGKVAITDYLIELSKKHDWFTWTGFANGLFFDYVLRFGAPFNLREKKATVVDTGDEPFSPATLPYIGRVVAVALQQPDKTANRFVRFASFTTTQNEIVKILEEESDAKFEVTNVTSAALEKSGDDNMAAGKAFPAFIDYLFQHEFGKGQGHGIKAGQNFVTELGLGEEDLRETLRGLLKEVA